MKDKTSELNNIQKNTRTSAAISCIPGMSQYPVAMSMCVMPGMLMSFLSVSTSFKSSELSVSVLCMDIRFPYTTVAKAATAKGTAK